MRMSSVFHQLTRPIRSQYCHRAENEVLLECRKRILTSWGHHLSFSRDSSFFHYSLNRQCLRQKFWQGFKSSCNEKLILLGEILTKQCNFYASQRLRRMSQIWNLYTRLYTERSFNQIVSKFARELRGKQTRPIAVLLGVAFFSWEKEKISDEEIESCVGELGRLHCSNQNVSQLPKLCGCELTEKLCDDGWEAVIKKENLQVWRKAFPNSYLYEYKVLGSFFDIPARAFFSVQTDIEYRKKWDKLVIKLDVIDKEDGGCEVVHWVMHYPYPMYSRDYVYIRRAVVNTHNNTMVLVSRATDHPSCPESKKYVRVTKYSSRMVIRPHGSFDENGFDYVLTYFDDPQAAFPAPAYNWMASSGVPDFVEKLHSAAQDLYFQSWWNKTSLAQAKSSNQPCPSGDMDYIYA